MSSVGSLVRIIPFYGAEHTAICTQPCRARGPGMHVSITPTRKKDSELSMKGAGRTYRGSTTPQTPALVPITQLF